MIEPAKRPLLAAALLVVVLVVLACTEGRQVADAASTPVAPPPTNAIFDYQIGGDYPLPEGVSVVSRDWFSGDAAADPVYSICYVNAFQTQADEPGVDRPDEHSNWPHAPRPQRARRRPPLGRGVPGRRQHGQEAPARGRLGRADDRRLRQQGIRGGRVRQPRLVDALRRDAAGAGRPVRQTRRPGLREAPRRASPRPRPRRRPEEHGGHDAGPGADVGFDFAIAEDCTRWHECNGYRHVYGNHVIAIEYKRRFFRKACRAAGDKISVVLRDRQVTTPGSPHYVYDAC